MLEECIAPQSEVIRATVSDYIVHAAGARTRVGRRPPLAFPPLRVERVPRPRAAALIDFVVVRREVLGVVEYGRPDPLELVDPDRHTAARPNTCQLTAAAWTLHRDCSCKP